MFTPMPRWAGWKEDSWGASHQGHSESKALELCHFSLHGGAACILGCGVSARESPGSEDQQRQPDRPLRPPAWLPGTVFTELHTGDRAGAERWDPLPHLLQGQEGVPYCQQSAAPARGEWRCRRDPAPRAPMRHKGTQIPETSLRAPRGSLLDSCSHVNLDRHLLPKPALRALPRPGPHAQSLPTYLYEYQKSDLKPPLIPCSRSWGVGRLFPKGVWGSWSYAYCSALWL